MLILSVAYEANSGVTAPDDNILTYAAGPGDTFTINSLDLPALGTGPGYSFQDTKFVWAFISFDDPIEPFVLPGDYNRDALVDQADYHTWRSQFGRTTGWRSADGNGDGTVDTADYVYWRNQAGTAAAGVPERKLHLPFLACVIAARLRRRFRRPLYSS